MPPRPLLAMALVLATTSACASGTGGQAGPGATSTGASVASCGPVPSSTGPAAPLVTVRVVAPTSAAAGATIPVQAVADVSGEGPRIITIPSASRFLLVSDGHVVGSSDPGAGPAGVPMPLTAGASRSVQALPDSVTLVGCAPPDGSAGRPLAPGTYDVVAVLAYGQDPLQGAAAGTAGSFTLVSPPQPVTVR